MSNPNDEPSLDKIDDYNGTETRQKRNTVRLIVVLCLIVGAVVVYFKNTSVSDDYVGTQEQPGITATKK